MERMPSALIVNGCGVREGNDRVRGTQPSKVFWKAVCRDFRLYTINTSQTYVFEFATASSCKELLDLSGDIM